MSLRYTGEATMEGPALRDFERWKDKIEVRLDNRQVFFLFFGSAMVACMLFVLGVIVGKRLETRGRAEATTIDDPLAALDRVGAPSTATCTPGPATHPALTFPRTLIAGTGPTARNRGAAPGREERAREDRASTGRPGTRPVLTATGPVGPSRVVVPVAEPAAPPPAAAAAAAAAAAPSGPPAAAGVPPHASPRTAPPTVAASAVPDARPRGHYLLQLSSFQDRAEAEAFVRRFPGNNAYIVSSELPGKGTWYRVRVGDFSTLQEASAAKSAFEREHNVIAYVAGTGPAR